LLFLVEMLSFSDILCNIFLLRAFGKKTTTAPLQE